MKKTNKPTSLYIHIPFCSHICKYCDFTKLFYNEKFSHSYIEHLLKEIDSYKINKVKTIYIGGGTPTSLTDDELETILKHVSSLLETNGEFTVEANVENLTINKLLLMKKYGVNRLSIGIQSSSNKLLKEIGREHSFEDAIKAVESAKNIGFNNINVDFIYGFPGQTLEDLVNDLNKFIRLDVDHVSIYSLIVEKGSLFFKEGINEQNEDDSREFYETILNFLRENGYKRYEVSNFARHNKFSKHNMNYWKDGEYYGVGLGASGYVDGKRYINTKNLSTYCEDNYCFDIEIVTKENDLEYFLLCNLRMEDGFKIDTFIDRFGIAAYNRLLAKADKYIKSKDIILDSQAFRLSDNGLLIMDHILLDLI